VVWSDFQAKAMFARVFVLTACLLLMYFLLRLVYRFMRDRETFSFRDVVETMTLLVITAIPIILIGVWVIEFTKPDISEIEKMAAEFQGFQSAQQDD
jgi:integral membrane sensor domain MASE1